MTTGRNMPCPCGSGKKYKKCCLNKQHTPSAPSVSLNEIMAGFAQNLVQAKNGNAPPLRKTTATNKRSESTATGKSDFRELPKSQIDQLSDLSQGPNSSVEFSDIEQGSESAPLLKLFTLLHKAIGEKGLEFSEEGDLPQPFLEDAARCFWSEQEYQTHTATSAITNETDFFDMHRLRIIAGQAGVVRKYKGKFIVGTKYRKPISVKGAAAIFGELFTAYVTTFDWALRDGQKGFDHIKHSFLFSLYLLSTYGNEPRTNEFYEDCYLKTFPTAVSDMAEKSDTESVRKLYFQRTFMECFTFFGLAEIVPHTDDSDSTNVMVKKLPLLDTFVTFTS